MYPCRHCRLQKSGSSTAVLCVPDRALPSLAEVNLDSNPGTGQYLEAPPAFRLRSSLAYPYAAWG